MAAPQSWTWDQFTALPGETFNVDIHCVTKWFPVERPGLAANVEAAGQSGIYGGLHYRFDIVAGQVLGRKVAEHVLATRLPAR